MSEQGYNDKRQEYWTTVGGRRIYARTIEALARTVAYGWIEKKSNAADSDSQYICIYCGREWYIISEPCSCILTKGDQARRANAMNVLNKIIYDLKMKDKKNKK